MLNRWLSAYCAVTCDRCAEQVPETSVPCLDIDEQCRGRKQAGQCTQYKP